MLRILTASVILNTALVGATFAQPLPRTEIDENGIYTDGHIELEYNFSDDASSTDYVVHLDGSVGYLVPGDGLRWGVDLTAEGFYISDDHITTINGSLLLDTAVGLFSIGAPRSVYDDYQPDTFTDRIVFLEASFGLLTGSASRYISFVTEDTPLGLRYDGQTAALRYGLSYQDFSDEDMTVIAAAMSYDVNDWHLAAGVDHLQLEGGKMTSYFASAGVDYGRFGGQATFNHVGEIFGSIDILEATAFYRPIGPLTLNAGAMFFDGTNDRGVFASAEYEFDSGAYITAELGDMDGDRYSSLSLGVKF